MTNKVFDEDVCFFYHPESESYFTLKGYDQLKEMERDPDFQLSHEVSEEEYLRHLNSVL